jgi:hypothetical protein
MLRKQSSFSIHQNSTLALFLSLLLVLVSNSCGSESNAEADIGATESDELPIDSEQLTESREGLAVSKLAQKDVDIEATLKKSGIKLKDNTLPPEQQSKIDQALEEKRRSSFLNGKKPEEAIKLYEQFLKSFNASRSTDLDQMAKWANDYWHSTYKSELEWYRLKTEEIEESLGY